MNKIKVCCISDTHLNHSQLKIPECDLLIHSGDFSYVGKMIDVIEVNQWLGTLKEKGIIKEAVLICGNHDFIGQQNPSWTKVTFTNCHYLDEESIELFGFKIFGSPWVPKFGRWAFMADRGEAMARHWAKIPEDTEILVTHGPPHSILDIDTEMIYSLPLGPEHLGCEELKQKVDTLKNLKLHVFGHIHSSSDEKNYNGIRFVNASVLNESYKVVYPPRVIHLEK